MDDLVRAIGDAVYLHKAWRPRYYDKPSTVERVKRSREEAYRVVRAALAAIPDGRDAALMEALTPSAETKGAYIGEFTFPMTYTDEHGDEYSETVTVPWPTIKEIMAAILARALKTHLPSPPAQEGDG